MKECEILMRWALRFDGEKYRQNTGFKPGEFAERFFVTWTLTWADPLDCLAAFYLWQRFLMKWGGERLPSSNRHWGLFRALFLHTARMDVPERYQGGDDWNGECYRIWRRDWGQHVEEHLEIVCKIHEGKRYSTEEPTFAAGPSKKKSEPPGKRVQICEHKGEPSTYISAGIKDNGDLEMSGIDIGKSVEERFGSEDYEYWVTVPAKQKDAVLLSLLEAHYRGSGMAEVSFKQLLTEKGIPFKFFCY
ncbi:MAG: hypothetical protein H0V54_14935 [Chthoniobacterales bacterium]|nr:hypothetical protein [Chthoniobacterales bacterium]